MTSRGLAEALLAEALAAHGGTKRWQSLQRLEAQVSAWGLLFRAKRRPLLNHQCVRVSTRESLVWFDDYPKPGLTGELQGVAAVRIRDAAGAIVEQRSEPRAYGCDFHPTSRRTAPSRSSTSTRTGASCGSTTRPRF